MKKLALLLAIFMVVSVPLEVSAATYIYRATPSLSFSGTTATCKATVRSDASDHIEVTMKLMYGTTTVASWSGEGYGYVHMSKTTDVVTAVHIRR